MKRNIYLALGDSVTAGYGASHPNMTFVHHLSEYTREQSLAERTLVIAENGWTTRDVLRASSAVHKSAFEQTSVLSLITGGNDLRRLLRRQYFGSAITSNLIHKSLHEFEYDMNQLCDRVGQYRIPHVIVATMYNPAPNSEIGVYAIESLNQIIGDIVRHYGFITADVYSGFQKSEAYYIENYRSGKFEDLASPFHRPIHPNNAGHRRIADVMIQCLGRAVNTDRMKTAQMKAGRRKQKPLKQKA